MRAGGEVVETVSSPRLLRWEGAGLGVVDVARADFAG